MEWNDHTVDVLVELETELVVSGSVVEVGSSLDCRLALATLARNNAGAERQQASKYACSKVNAMYHE